MGPGDDNLPAIASPVWAGSDRRPVLVRLPGVLVGAPFAISAAENTSIHQGRLVIVKRILHADELFVFPPRNNSP